MLRHDVAIATLASHIPHVVRVASNKKMGGIYAKRHVTVVADMKSGDIDTAKNQCRAMRSNLLSVQ